MSTLSVRKFAISLDPQHVVDFSQSLDYFAGVFQDLGFTPSGTYSFRYSDHECMVKIELQRSPDGYYLWAYVQAIDEHEYRIRECADAIGAYVVSGGKKPI